MDQPTPPDVVPARSRAARIAYMVAGWIFFALGLIGALLPVIPTTPFMLLALWAFSMSSRRFHDWLYHHRIFGPRLQAWSSHRVVPRSVRYTAYAGMLISLSYISLIARLGWYIVVPTGALMLIGITFISMCPSEPPPADEP